MFSLTSVYKPLTANGCEPSKNLPCGALSPFIAEYWGTEDVLDIPKDKSSLIIPDTCMDLIFYVNHTKQTVSGESCGMDEQSFATGISNETDIVTCFAIRFYFWSIHLFVGDSLRGKGSRYDDAEMYFAGWTQDFTKMLLNTRTINERIAWAEDFLLKRLDISKHNSNVMNALYHMMKNRGAAKVSETCAYVCLGQRQLERLFENCIGTSIKKTANLIRYQNLWRDVATGVFNVQDAVEKYGFTDQSHLLRSFKKYHNNMTPREARNKVVFLQYD